MLPAYSGPVPSSLETDIPAHVSLFGAGPHAATLPPHPWGNLAGSVSSWSLTFSSAVPAPVLDFTGPAPVLAGVVPGHHVLVNNLQLPDGRTIPHRIVVDCWLSPEEVSTNPPVFPLQAERPRDPSRAGTPSLTPVLKNPSVKQSGVVI
jgi:hypothetical protein